MRERERDGIGIRLARLRALQRAFAERPAFIRSYLESALELPDLRDLVREHGADARRFETAIRAAEECAEYAREALESRAWGAAATDLARLIAAFESLAGGQCTSRRIRVAAPAHHSTCRLIQSVIQLFRPEALPHAAWRRLDVALWALGRTRRGLDRRSLGLLEVYAAPSALRPYLARSLGSAHREVRRNAARLLSEVEEAAEYAFAALDAGVRESAKVDLERLDACYRALRLMLRRESATYLPEPWPIRRLARGLTARRMMREAEQRRSAEADRAMENLGRRGLLDESPGILR